MANDARTNLVGNIINEPKTNTWNNSTILSFTVSVRTTKKQEGSQYYETDLYDITVWGKQGENLLNSIQKGTMVWVEGDQMMKSYKNRNGETVIRPSISASMVKVLAKGKNSNYQSNRQPADVAATAAQIANQVDSEEEPPF